MNQSVYAFLITLLLVLAVVIGDDSRRAGIVLHMLIFAYMQNMFSVTVPAYKQICARFPYLELCKESDMQKTTNQNTNLRVTLPPSDEYCSKYSTNYGLYCSVSTIDVVIKNFCQSYRRKCTIDENAYINNSPGTTAHLDSNLAHHIWNLQDIKHYCDDYQPDYNFHCINRQVDNLSVEFCTGFAAKCHGSESGSGLPAPNRGHHKHASVVPVVSTNWRPPQDLDLQAQQPAEALVPNDQLNQRQDIDWTKYRY